MQKEDLINLIGKTIQFNKTIEDWETYAEEGMKAKIIKFNYDDRSEEPVHKLFIDYSEFEVENHKRQNANYYDSTGMACLTAVEANCYSPQEWLYIDDDPELLPFEMVA